MGLFMWLDDTISAHGTRPVRACALHVPARERSMAMAEVKTLERGDIYMAFRPTVDTDDPEKLDDVQRFYVILSARDSGRYRLLVVGRKTLRDPRQSGREREWAFVQAVSRNPADIENLLDTEHYKTKTRGARETLQG
jgi:hypothetical protein